MPPAPAATGQSHRCPAPARPPGAGLDCHSFSQDPTQKDPFRSCARQTASALASSALPLLFRVLVFPLLFLLPPACACTLLSLPPETDFGSAAVTRIDPDCGPLHIDASQPWAGATAADRPSWWAASSSARRAARKRGWRSGVQGSRRAARIGHLEDAGADRSERQLHRARAACAHRTAHIHTVQGVPAMHACAALRRPAFRRRPAGCLPPRCAAGALRCRDSAHPLGEGNVCSLPQPVQRSSLPNCGCRGISLAGELGSWALGLRQPQRQGGGGAGAAFPRDPHTGLEGACSLPPPALAC